MTDRLRVEEFADVLVGQVGEAVDDPIPESSLSPRVFGLPEFAYSERIAPRYVLLVDDDPPPTILRRGDVVVGLAGQYLGNTMSVFMRFDGAILGRDCAVIRVRDEGMVLADWVYAWSRTQDFRRQVLREVVGATIQRLTPRGLRTLSLPLFPLKDQERIGAVAGAFDDALDAARLTVSDLEELRDRQLDVELYNRLERDGKVGKAISADRPRPRPRPRPKTPIENISTKRIEPRPRPTRRPPKSQTIDMSPIEPKHIRKKPNQ